MFGWHGQALHINLSTDTTRPEPISQELLHNYLGGRGLGVRLMRDFHQLDPFHPKTPLIFATGPLCGSATPTTERLTVVSRSPLTGTVFDSSVGGKFAWNLKQAGYDALIITGQSSKPVWLKISPGNVKTEEATALWGATVPETIKALSGHGTVATIGPAGENRVLYASIMMDGEESAGRGGLGAVMGSKNLKAIVVNGDKTTAIAEPERVIKAQQDIMRLFRASPFLLGELGIAEYGTPALVDLMNQRRMTPTDNFQRTHFDGASKYSGPAIRHAFNAQKTGCCKCPIQCKKTTPEGEQLPEFESISHFGALLDNHDLGSIVQANTICNDMGIDPISAAATISAWAEIKGFSPTSDEIKKLLHDIAYQRNDGQLLALGSKRLADHLRKPDASMSVKSLELPAYDPRGAYGMALAYCTSNHGGCHLHACPISHEILRKPVATDRFSFAGKGRINKIAEDSHAAIDSLIACKFSFFGASLEEYAESLSGVTGCEYSPLDLIQIGERIYLTERFYNQQNGFIETDDMLPKRFFSEAGSSGEGIDIKPINQTRFKEERQKYYRIRGLDDQGRIKNANFLAEQP